MLNAYTPSQAIIKEIKTETENTNTYSLEFTGKLNCEYEIYLTSPSLTFYVTGNFKDTLTNLKGNVVFTKSDLALRDISAEIKGISAAKISPIPIPLPIPFKATITGDLSTDFPLFDFPLYVPKFWDLPTMNIEMKVNFGGIFGFISIPITMTVQYQWTPLAFHCKDQGSVSVEAGTFNAYEISSTFFDLFDYFYAPAAGNLVKLDANMDNGEVHGELKSTNYT